MFLFIFEFQKEIEVSRKLSIQLLDSMKKALLTEIERGGPVGAIRVCSYISQNIIKTYQKDYGLYIRRISERYRNEANKPDPYEYEILRKLDSLNRNNKLPNEYYEITIGNNKEYIRYFKPIVVQGNCLVCHGTNEYIPKDIKDFLSKEYPNDKAREYKVGDFRGAVSVKVEIGDKKPYKNISPFQVKEIIEKQKNVIIIDVRTREEFSSGYIKGAINIPVQELEKRLKELENHKNKSLIVYCRSGNRSRTASEILVKNGFKNVYNLSGGIIEWTKYFELKKLEK